MPLTARLPTIDPMTASDSSVPMMSTALSAVPNQSIAQSFTAGGTTSITSWPTGTTGDIAPRTRPDDQLGRSQAGERRQQADRDAVPS